LRLPQGGRLTVLAILAVLPCPSWAALRHAPAASLAEPEIIHAPLECWPRGEFLVLRARFRPGADILTAKAYFRSDKHLEFHFVELIVNTRGDGYAVMPKTAPETAGVDYYLEAVTRGYTTSRSEQWNSTVAEPGECIRRHPEMTLFNGEKPDIVVGATRAGAPPLPPGFQAAGVTKFISAAGLAGNASGGGIGTKTALIGGGGGAALLLALTAGGGSAPTNTTPGAVVSTTTTTSPTPAGGSTTVSTTTTTSGGGSTTTIGGGPTTTGPSTTTVVGGSTTTVVGSSTTTSGGSSSTTIGSSTTTTVGSSTTTAPSTSTTTVPSTTTSVSTTTTTVAAAADIAVSKSAPSSGRVGVILTYDISVTNNGPATATGARLVDNLPGGVTLVQLVGPCGAAGLTITCNFPNMPPSTSQPVLIRVSPNTPGVITNTCSASAAQPDPVPGNNSASATTNVTMSLLPERENAFFEFRSFLEIEPLDGAVRGRILVNGVSAETVTNSGPFLHRLSGAPGENRVEAFVEGGGRSGFWRFELAADGIPGSLRVEQGQVVSLDGQSVVFKLNGGEPVRFTFRLDR
jgi:hypothetical protein